MKLNGFTSSGVSISHWANSPVNIRIVMYLYWKALLLRYSLFHRWVEVFTKIMRQEEKKKLFVFDEYLYLWNFSNTIIRYSPRNRL